MHPRPQTSAPQAALAPELGLPPFPVASVMKLFHTAAMKDERVPVLQAYLRDVAAKARGGAMPVALQTFLNLPK